jgi:hypothetical protein
MQIAVMLARFTALQRREEPKKMEEKVDGSGNVYVETGNARITFVPRTWDESPGVRIQAKKVGGGLNWGPEIPVFTKEGAYDLIEALVRILQKIPYQG